MNSQIVVTKNNLISTNFESLNHTFGKQHMPFSTMKLVANDLECICHSKKNAQRSEVESQKVSN